MINRIDFYKQKLKSYNLTPFCPKFDQIMTENELIKLVPKFDFWIIGDDPCTRNVIEAGINGKLKFAVKWGIGTDNIDYNACKELNFPIPNTPGMFNEEVSNVAVGYLMMLAHNLADIDRESRKGIWHKPLGISLTGKKVAVIGFGNIGRSLVRKLLSFKMDVWVYDPGFEQDKNKKIICRYNRNLKIEPILNHARIDELDIVLSFADVVILVCALTDSSYHLINNDKIKLLNDNCFIVNVARGKIVNENDLIDNLKNGKIKGVALDVFEEEPITLKSELYNYNCIFGAHNSSNTVEGVDRTSFDVLKKIKMFIDNIKN